MIDEEPKEGDEKNNLDEKEEVEDEMVYEI